MGHRAADDSLARARAAAMAFCKEFGFPEEKISELEAPPLFGPVSIEREGRSVTAYRWLGGGRGGDFVQVELDEGSSAVVVLGGFADREFGPWSP